jgi:preprotein translocase subunit SecY
LAHAADRRERRLGYQGVALLLLGYLFQGVALLGLGAVLHWRRSFLAGALAVVADVAILLADPLRSINTWYLVAISGLAMIALVVFVERQRQRIPVWLGAWRQRLETWDRSGRA